jgi:hypothetical protein
MVLFMELRLTFVFKVLLKHLYSFISRSAGLYLRADWQVISKTRRAHVLALSQLAVGGEGTLGGRQLETQAGQ